MGKKNAKSTKKFEKKHLGAALTRRKKLKPMGNALRRKAAAFRSQVEEQEEAAPVEKQPGGRNQRKTSFTEDSQHKAELETLRDTDPAFYEFLQEHDKDLLEFDRDDDEEEEEPDLDLEPEMEHEAEVGKLEGSSKRDGTPLTLSASLVDEWCASVREKHHVGALRNLLQAFGSACHFGEGEEAKRSTKYTITSSNVFNKVLIFGLSEIDGVFRHILGLTGGEEKAGKSRGFSTPELQKHNKWKKMEPFVKSYLGNSLNILTQMTDNEMIAFTLRRLKVSVPFLGPFPKLSRRFLKAALHFFCNGDGILPTISFLLIREMALQLGDNVLDAALKGIYRDFAASARFVNSTTLPQIRFRASCVVELYGIDSRASYRLAFVFIQQMAFSLRNAITMTTKTAFKSVYCWQYINCLHLWVKVICMHCGEDELRQLLYPLVQIIGGVSQLVPTAKYFPLRLHCAKMLNELGSVTGAFNSVAPLLLDMLQFKELYMAPTGGAGKVMDFDTTLKIPKSAIKTQRLQEECVATVLEQIGEHLAQWSYAVAFPELAIIPILQLRQVLKKTNVDRFCRRVKQLVEQIEKNVQFIWSHRERIHLSLDDKAAVAAFLQAEKEARISPLSQYVKMLRQNADQRHAYVCDIRERKEDNASARKGKREVSSDDDSEDDIKDRKEDNESARKGKRTSSKKGKRELSSDEDSEGDFRERNENNASARKSKRGSIKKGHRPSIKKGKRELSSDEDSEADVVEDLVL